MLLLLWHLVIKVSTARTQMLCRLLVHPFVGGKSCDMKYHPVIIQCRSCMTISVSVVRKSKKWWGFSVILSGYKWLSLWVIKSFTQPIKQWFIQEQLIWVIESFAPLIHKHIFIQEQDCLGHWNISVLILMLLIWLFHWCSKNIVSKI